MTDSVPTKPKPLLVLTRLTGVASDCTLGVLQFPNGSFLSTIEKLYDDNKPEVSSIPVGKYVCKRTVASAGITADTRVTFEVCNVPGRSAILFHVANLASELKGCIGLGKEFGHVRGMLGVAYSAKAFQYFLLLLKGCDEFDLVIQDIADGAKIR